MPRIVYLDTGPLGLACHSRPVENRESRDIQVWLEKALAKRIRVIIPAVADYEVRRELVRNGSADSIAKLDLIESGLHPNFPGVVYLPLADAALRRGAELWALARNKGYATAGDQALDGDVLIAAQVLENAGAMSRFTIATGNAKDLARYVGSRRARLWTDILP